MTLNLETLMKRLILPTFVLALAGCGQTPEPDAPATVSITEATCRPTPKGLDVTGCYVTMTASQDDRLISVSAPQAGMAQVHEMKIENDVMKMAELKDGLALPAGEAVSLSPGGNHLMLMGLKQPLVAGDQVSITLTFERAQPMGIRALVAQPAVGGDHAAPH